jgi:hypothetical protein
VELLVSAALTMFIMGLFAVLMQSATRGVRDAKGINAVDQKLRNTIATLRSDLQQVYMANNGVRISPSELFTRYDKIPTDGFIEIRENDRALSQGVDASGNPVELDVNDAMGLTVFRGGGSKEGMFYGRAAQGYAQVQGVGDLGFFLDSIWRGPASRFDLPNNQLVTSPYAEVWYFARPQAGPATLQDMGADPWVLGNQGGFTVTTLPPVPKLHTLYRRVLLVLNDDMLNKQPTGGFGIKPVPINQNASFYNFFDVSASREIKMTNGTLQDDAALHFNTLADLTRREFRYGMQRVLVDYPAPFVQGNQSPYNAILTTNTLRAFPLSHVDSTAAGANPVPGLHDYYRTANPASRQAVAGSLFEPWIGLPTLAESAHPNFPFWISAVNSLTPTINMTIDPATNDLQTYPVTAGQRAGDDVLLRDVVSFDIKVLEYLAGYPGDDPTGANGLPDQPAPQASPANGQLLGHNLNAGGNLYSATNTAPDVTTAPFAVDPVRGRRSEFVDLGFLFDQGSYTNLPGLDVQTTANYLYQPVPAPTNPGSITYLGVTYNYATNFSTTGLDLTQPPFSINWGGATPPQPPGPAALPMPLRHGAYSPISAAFGVPLDLRACINPPSGLGTDVTRINPVVAGAPNNSDVWFGPDGKAGIAGFPDAFDHQEAPDTGPFAKYTGTVADHNEYFAPRSDDLDVDPTNANSAYSVLLNRPGLFGPDNKPGARGFADDAQPFNTTDQLSKPFGPATWYLSELFTPGTDDNPYVGVPFGVAGQVAADPLALGATSHPFNLGNLNPRNTYDSWSAAPDVSHYDSANNVTYVTLPAYAASPVRQMHFYTLPAGTPPTVPQEQSYVPEPNFRPVPYPRPLKGIQIKLRVYERRTGLVREATIRHFFKPAS